QTPQARLDSASDLGGRPDVLLDDPPAPVHEERGRKRLESAERAYDRSVRNKHLVPDVVRPLELPELCDRRVVGGDRIDRRTERFVGRGQAIDLRDLADARGAEGRPEVDDRDGP